MQPKITIIIPAYNVEQYIERCITSVLNQTFHFLEVIVIDDGSSDATGTILDELAKKDSRLVVIHQANAGLVMVREKGIALASGDYVGFVDGDDAVDPDMYERLLRNAIETEADISHCGLCVYWDEVTTEPHYGTGKKMVQSSAEALRDLLQGVIFDVSLCNKLYRRELLTESCLDVSVQSNEDLLRNFVLFSRAKSIVYEDFCGYQYWSRENSMSNDAKVVQRNRQVIKVRRIIAEHASEEIYPYAKRLLLSTYVGAINQNYHSSDPQMQALCKECRAELKKEKKNIPYLIRRQQIAAYLIMYAPWLHRWVYKIYDSRR